MADPAHEYLGDAVYAQHDGYMVGLSLDSHDNPPLIWLEPEVIAALINYAKRHELVSIDL